jgi:hypothetical protein
MINYIIKDPIRWYILKTVFNFCGFNPPVFKQPYQEVQLSFDSTEIFTL